MKKWLQKAWRAGLTYAQERPWKTTLVLQLLALALGVATAIAPAELLAGFDRWGVELAIGVLSLASILAGFAGVVVVFALQGDSQLFVSFRNSGGAVLRRAWLFLVRASFLAAAASLLSAGAFALDLGIAARSLLLVAVGFSLHSALSMLWLLRLLLDAVGVEDTAKVQRRQTFGDAADLYDS